MVIWGRIRPDPRHRIQEEVQRRNYEVQRRVTGERGILTLRPARHRVYQEACLWSGRELPVTCPVH